MNLPRNHSGFTIIELAIVLVIIGLIIGGVLVGQALIKASELRNVLSEAEEFQLAIRTFVSKYNALPGDMSNASSILDANALNGSGNHNVSRADIANSAEAYYFFQHLGLAKLIKGEYPGVASGVHTNPVAGDVAASRWPNAIWAPMVSNMLNRNWWKPSTHIEDNYVALIFGESGSSHTSGNVLTVLETRGLDDKIDDGLPGKGKFGTQRAGNCLDTSCASVTGCVTSGNLDIAVYQTDTSHTKNCNAVFYLDKR